MGQQHNELRRGDLSEALTRALGDSRGGGGIERYGETLTPVINLWGLPEWAFLRRERLAGMGRTEGAGAATEMSYVALVNPATSGILIVVESALVSLNVASAVRAAMETEAALVALGLTATRGVNLDTRWANQGNEPIGYLASEAVAATLGVAFSNPTRPVYFDLPEVAGIVLSPGYALVVQNPDDAAAIHVSYRWRERHAYPSELV